MSYWRGLVNGARHALPAVGVFVAGVALSILAWTVAADRVEQSAVAKVDAAIADASEAIQARLLNSYDIVYGLQGLFRTSEQVTREKFERYVSGLGIADRHPAIRTVSYAQRVPAEALPALAARMRHEKGGAGRASAPFAIKPPGERAEYLPIVAVMPAANEGVIGIDLYSGERRESVERARDSGEPAVSGRFALAVDPAQQPAFAVRLALYRNDMPTGTEEERRAAFSGVVSTTFLASGLVGDILTHPSLAPMSISLHDRFMISGGLALGARAVDHLLFEKQGPAVDPADRGYFTRNLLLDIGGRTWHLLFSGSTRAFATATDRALTWILLIGGLMTSVLLALLVQSLTSSRERAHKLATRITEDLRRSEASLAEAQRLTQSMIEALPNPIFFKDTDGRYRGVNQAWEKFFGIPRAAFIGHTVYDLYPRDKPVADQLHAADQELWEKPGSQSYEAVIPAADGARHHVMYYKATYSRGDGAVAGLIGTIVDISDRKRLEQQFQATFEQAAVGIAHFDLQYRVIRVNLRYSEIVGYAPEELIGKTSGSLNDPDDPLIGSEQRARLLSGELDHYSQERRYRRKDGKVIWVTRTESLARDADGAPQYYIRVIEDITQRKEAEAERQRTEADRARLAAIVENSNDAIIGRSLEGIVTSWNAGAQRIFGYTREEMIGRSITVLVPEDNRNLADNSEKLRRGEPIPPNEATRVTKDGRIIDVLSSISPVKNAAGEVIGAAVIVRDISELKEAEQRYRATVDNAPVGIMHTAIADDRILHANSRLCEMLGYTQEELARMHTDDFVHPQHVGVDQPKYREAMLKGEIATFSSERLYRRKDGSDLWVNRTVSLVRDRAAHPLYFIRIVEDISQRKQAEQRQAMEHAITKVLAEAESTTRAIPKVIQTICETMGWHYGDRYEFDTETALLKRREYWAVDTPELRAFAASAAHRFTRPDGTGTGLIRRTYMSAKPVWISDILQQAGFQRRELAQKAGLHGAFAFPLVASGQVLGVMEFFHRDVREPDAMLIQIAEAIGSQIGQFMVRMQAEEAVKFVAMHDSLTNLPNRIMFNQRLEQALAQAHRHSKRLAVMFIDLDRFKVINDTLGHEAGDQLLREVAQRVTENLRSGDMVARLGGDEFVVLIEDVADLTSAGTVAEKLIASLTANFMVAGSEVHVTASIGIATYPDDAVDMRSLLKYADIAMYRAKEQGRNTFQFYSAQMNVHSVERLTLESQLRGALDRNELVLFYQPSYDVRTERIVGMEALVRWQHPELGLLAPGRFIGIAEETGLIVPIGEWVLRTACAQRCRWAELGMSSMRIAVNLSPRQFVHRHLAQEITHALSHTGCDPTCLELEITETAIMHNAPRAVALLSELKAMGIRIAIDDFGTGYSSLAYLKRFPIDSLKIDRSFVADVPRDPGGTAITQAVIAMAHSLKLTVIAEGVETAEQLEFLRGHGCDEVQGYYYSAPLSVLDATALLKQHYAAASNVTSFARRRS